jgi:hypothetical protein
MQKTIFISEYLRYSHHGFANPSLSDINEPPFLYFLKPKNPIIPRRATPNILPRTTPITTLL